MPYLPIISINDIYARISPDKVRRAYDDDNDGAPDDPAIRRLWEDSISLVMGKVVNTYTTATIKKMLARVDGLKKEFATSTSEEVILAADFDGRLGASNYHVPRRLTVWQKAATAAYNIDDPIVVVGTDEDDEEVTAELYLTEVNGADLLTLEDYYWKTFISITIPPQLLTTGAFKLGAANDVHEELKRLALDAAQAYYGMRHPEVANYDGGAMLKSVIAQLQKFGEPNGRRLDRDDPPEPAHNHGGDVIISEVYPPGSSCNKKLFIDGIDGW